MRPTNPSSNSPRLATPGILHAPDIPTVSEMSAFDKLPPILREALRIAPIDVSATECLAEYLKTRNAPELAREISAYFIAVLNKARAAEGLPLIQSLK